MRTLPRILIGGGAAIAVAVGSFAVTSSLRSSDELALADSEFPPAPEGYVVEHVPVLLPAAVGDEGRRLDGDSLAPSESDGVAQVTVPAWALAPAEDINVPESPLEPGVEQAAHALDLAAGDPLLAVTASLAIGEDLPAAGPSPSVSPLEPLSDPCAVGDGAVAEECPEGLTGTLFSLTGGELSVWGTGAPGTTADQGRSVYCPVVDGAGTGLRIGALTTGPAAVTVSYWPQSSIGELRTIDLEPTVTDDGGMVMHCGITGELDPGMYAASAIATDAGGRLSEAHHFWFDSRGEPTIPAMTVVPLGTNWAWVGVRHTADQSVDLDGWMMTYEGAPESCAAAVDAGRLNRLRQDIATHTTAVSRERLHQLNINSAYTRMTAALFYVPQGVSAGICGATYNTDDPSWSVDSADRLQFATVSAPDRWAAVATVREITAYRSGVVYLTGLSPLGGSCGRPLVQGITAPDADAASTVSPAHSWCTVQGHGIQADIRTTFKAKDGSSQQDQSRMLLRVPSGHCVGVCPQPEPLTFKVPLPGLGQDPCPDSDSHTCATPRRTMPASAIVDVEWVAGGGNLREEWGVSVPRDEEIVDADGDATRFDTLSSVSTTMSADGFSAQATLSLRWSQAVDYSVSLAGTCFAGNDDAESPPAVTGRSESIGGGLHGATVTVGGLCASASYEAVVTYTDHHGTTSVAAPSGVSSVPVDVTWAQGSFATPREDISIEATVTITRHDRLTNAYWVRDYMLTVSGQTMYPSFGSGVSDRCTTAGSVTSAPASQLVAKRHMYDISPSINVTSDVIYLPTSATCQFRNSDTWAVGPNAQVSYEQLMEGVEFRGSMRHLQGAAVGMSYVPFTYRMVLKGYETSVSSVTAED